jgi:hypothetical protein
MAATKISRTKINVFTLLTLLWYMVIMLYDCYITQKFTDLRYYLYSLQ